MIYYFEEIEKIKQREMKIIYPYLSEQRKQKVNKYKYLNNKRQSAIAYLLLKYGLKQEFGLKGDINLEFGTYGKPYLHDYNRIQFNLSHCDEGVICIISDSIVGADITEVSTKNLLYMENTLSISELRAVLNAEFPAKQFAMYWSLKESYIKYLGLGIDNYIKDIDFSIAKSKTFNFRGKSFSVFENKNAIITSCSNKHIDLKKIGIDEMMDFVM